MRGGDLPFGILSGVAPPNRDSGVFRGKRRVWSGRAAVRQMLYMAAVTAARCNPVFKEFYGRVLAAGKPRIVDHHPTCAHGVHAQAAGRPQRDAQARYPMGTTRPTGSRRR